MNTTSHLKSFIVGLLAGGLLVAAIGAGTPSRVGQPGRYQISASGTGVAYIVDTTTGQAWLSTVKPAEFFETKPQ